MTSSDDDLVASVRQKLEERAAQTAETVDGERLAELERQNAELRSKLRRLEARTRLRRTLARYGVSVHEIRPAEWQALAARIPRDGDLSEEWVAGAVSELQLPFRRS